MSDEELFRQVEAMNLIPAWYFEGEEPDVFGERQGPPNMAFVCHSWVMHPQCRSKPHRLHRRARIREAIELADRVASRLEARGFRIGDREHYPGAYGDRFWVWSCLEVFP